MTLPRRCKIFAASSRIYSQSAGRGGKADPARELQAWLKRRQVRLTRKRSLGLICVPKKAECIFWAEVLAKMNDGGVRLSAASAVAEPHCTTTQDLDYIMPAQNIERIITTMRLD